MVITVFIIPLFELMLFAYALSFDITNIPTAVYDQDMTASSRSYVRAFESAEYFSIKQYIQNKSEIDTLLDTGKIKTVIRIPHGFEHELKGGGNTSTQILVEGSDPNVARVASGYAATISRDFNNKLRTEYFTRRGLDIGERLQAIEPRSRVWYNPNLKSANFLVPGLIAILMMNITIIQTVVAIVREKAQHTIEQLIVSPIKPYELMIGKILPFLGIACIDVLGISLLSIFWFRVPFRGSVLVMLVSTALFLIGTLGTGLTVSAVSNSLESANQLGMFVSFLPAFMLSGFIFPIANLPKVLQLVSYLVPARYFIEITRGVFLKGTGFGVLWPQMLGLAVYGFFSVGLAAKTFKKKI
jgi:ABC-2 type transport system permease protein